MPAWQRRRPRPHPSRPDVSRRAKICRSLPVRFAYLPPGPEDKLLSIFCNFIWVDGCRWRKQPLKHSGCGHMHVSHPNCPLHMGTQPLTEHSVIPSAGGRGWAHGLRLASKDLSSLLLGRGPHTQDLMRMLAAALPPSQPPFWGPRTNQQQHLARLQSISVCSSGSPGLVQKRTLRQARGVQAQRGQAAPAGGQGSVKSMPP